MTREDHLLVILAEECGEVAKECAKALRFGIDHTNPHELRTNADLIAGEIHHVRAMISMLEEAGMIDARRDRDAEAAKRAKVEEFLLLSEREGRLLPLPTGTPAREESE